jgi:hypothetical protein
MRSPFKPPVYSHLASPFLTYLSFIFFTMLVADLPNSDRQNFKAADGSMKPVVLTLVHKYVPACLAWLCPGVNFRAPVRKSTVATSQLFPPETKSW